MAYRDDLHAARLHITELEARIAELGAGRGEPPEMRRLKRRLHRLQTKITSLRKLLPHSARRTALTPAAGMVVCGLIAFIIVTGRSERGAWEMMNLTLAAGIALPLWSWGRVGQLVPALGAAVLKVGVLAAWGSGWWAATEASVGRVESSLGSFDAKFYFLWLAPVFVLAVALAEGGWIYLFLRGNDALAEHAGEAKPERIDDDDGQ